jgi:hypothetical protein
MVIVLAMPLNPRFVDSNPTESDGFLMVIKKIICTTSFGGEIKPSSHVIRFYSMLKIL